MGKKEGGENTSTDRNCTSEKENNIASIEGSWRLLQEALWTHCSPFQVEMVVTANLASGFCVILIYHQGVYYLRGILLYFLKKEIWRPLLHSEHILFFQFGIARRWQRHTSGPHSKKNSQSLEVETWQWALAVWQMRCQDCARNWKMKGCWMKVAFQGKLPPLCCVLWFSVEFWLPHDAWIFQWACPMHSPQKMLFWYGKPKQSTRGWNESQYLHFLFVSLGNSRATAKSYNFSVFHTMPRCFAASSL